MEELTKAYKDTNGDLHETKSSALRADFKESVQMCSNIWFRHPSGQVRKPEDVLTDIGREPAKLRKFVTDVLALQESAFAVFFAEKEEAETDDEIPDFREGE